MVQLRQLLFDQHLDGTLKVSRSVWWPPRCHLGAPRCVLRLRPWLTFNLTLQQSIGPTETSSVPSCFIILCHCNCSFVFGTFRISKTDGTISVVQPSSATMFVFVAMRRVKTSPRTERASMVLRISVIYGSIPSCKCRWVTPTLFLTCLFEHLFRCVVHSLSFRRSVFGSTTAVRTP